MGVDDSQEPWIAKLRLLARRVSSAMPATATAREATLLGCLFLAVGLLGGLRIADADLWRPPPLFALVLALLMMGVVNRRGAFAADRFLSASRSMPGNLNGLLAILAIMFASAQMFALTTPDALLPRMLANALFLVALLALIALPIATDRQRLLRVLIAIFGTAFTVKFVVLPSCRPELPVAICRFITGGFGEPRHPATGYLAFLTLLLYLLALARLVPIVRDIPDRSSSESADPTATSS